MTFHVRTAVFEGPLDLLLQLITKHQVEITTVGLTDVVGEYLSFLDEMRVLDLDVTSEFLLIAATLVQLKAHSLLPTASELDFDDELALAEERDRLLSRLLASVTFKDVAAVLRRRLEETTRFVPRISGLDQKIEAPTPEFTIPVPVEPDLDHLDLDLPSVELAIEELRERLGRETFTSFEELTEHCSRPIEVAAYFLALLEMARWGLIEVTQSDWTAAIEVRHLDDGSIDLTSEWST
jgi:segregation and condensation protein A